MIRLSFIVSFKRLSFFPNDFRLVPLPLRQTPATVGRPETSTATKKMVLTKVRVIFRY